MKKSAKRLVLGLSLLVVLTMSTTIASAGSRFVTGGAGLLGYVHGAIYIDPASNSFWAYTSSDNTVDYMTAELKANGVTVATAVAGQNSRRVSTRWYTNSNYYQLEGKHYVDARSRGGSYWFGTTTYPNP